MTLPFLSIVIPTKDRPHILANCLSHLHQCQFEFDFEVVIVDGSTDTATQLLVQTHPLKDKIIYLEEPNNLPHGNVPAYMMSPIATLIGALHAKGTFFCYLGDDDYIVDTNLNEVAQELKSENIDGWIPRLTAWDDVEKKEIANLVNAPPDSPTYGPHQAAKLFHTIQDRTIYPEYFIYRTDKFLHAAHYLPGCYLHLLWLFLMNFQGNIKLDKRTLFVLTRRSNLFDLNREDTPTPEFCRKMPDALARTCELIHTRLLAQEGKTMCQVGTPVTAHLGYYYCSSLIDAAMISILQGDYYQMYIDCLRYLFWMPTPLAERSRKELMDVYFKEAFPYFLTSLLIFRSQLLIQTECTALWRFKNPEKIATNAFLKIAPKLPLSLDLNNQPPAACASHKNIFFITPKEKDRRALIEAGVPPAHGLSYEALHGLFELPFVPIQYDL